MKYRPRPTQQTLLEDFRPVVTPEAVHKVGRGAYRRRAAVQKAPAGTRHNVDIYGQQAKMQEMRRLMAGGLSRAEAERKVWG